jgi:hypothetical protein
VSEEALALRGLLDQKEKNKKTHDVTKHIAQQLL